jgi:hypothetical protein
MVDQKGFGRWKRDSFFSSATDRTGPEARAFRITALPARSPVSPTRSAAPFARLVDAERPATELSPVQLADGLLRVGIVHLNEREATRPAGLAIGDQVDLVNGAKLLEKGADVSISTSKG